MIDRKLTDKEWEILLYFIKNNGYSPIKQGLKANDRLCGPFISYPAMIERDLGGDVTRGWASKICADFEASGIFGHVMIRPPRQKHETEHYFLRRDLDALRKVVRLVIEHAAPDDRHRLLSFSYFRSLIDGSLIKEVLYEKGVEMWRTIELAHWSDEDAGRLFTSYAGSDADFAGFVRSRLYGEAKPGESPFDEISLRLPVFPDSMPKEKQAAIFQKLNKKELDRYPFIRFDSSGIKSHYKRWQYDKLILPILVLTQVSPGAIAEFLYGDWRPYSQEPPVFKPEGTTMMEHAIFRLLFIAINDLASTRSIPGDGIARMAWLRKSNNTICDTDQDALFTVSLNNGRNLYFDGGFDTLHDFYRNDSSYEPNGDLDYWVRTWVGFDGDSGLGILLTEGNIKDVRGLIVRLCKKQDFMAGHIRDRLSYEMRRSLTHIDASLPTPAGFLKALIDELNELIMGDCIYDDLAFKGVKLSDDTRKLLDHVLSNGRNVPGTVDTYILNRSLLTDAFPGEIVKDDNMNV